MRQNTYLKAQKCSKFVAWPHVRNNYSHKSQSVSSYEFCDYFIDRGFANRAKSWIQLRTNTVHYHFAFLSPGSCFKATICIQLESAPISDRLVFAAVEGWQNYSPVVRKIWGLRWSCSSIQKPPKHRFMFFPSTLSAKEVILRSRTRAWEFVDFPSNATCYPKKHTDWPQLSRTVHVLNRFYWTDWLKASCIVSSRSTSHYITLHHITSHYITLHHITSHYITLHHITSHYITLHHITSHYITLHHIASHCITLHHIALHCITLHCIALHFSGIHIFSRLYNLPPRQAFWSSRRPDSLAITTLALKQV